MEFKRCRNKLCQRLLPENYEHRYCENCRNKHANIAKKAVAGLLSFAVLVAGAMAAKNANEDNNSNE
jgi:hypothetical protein